VPLCGTDVALCTGFVFCIRVTYNNEILNVKIQEGNESSDSRIWLLKKGMGASKIQQSSNFPMVSGEQQK